MNQDLQRELLSRSPLHPKMETWYNALTPEEKEKLQFFMARIESNSFTFSPSSLKKLVNEPMIFFEQYVCGNFSTSESKAQLKGTLIHLMLSFPEQIEVDYYVLPENTGLEDAVYKTLRYLVSCDIDTEHLIDLKPLALAYLKEIGFQPRWGDDAKWKRFEEPNAIAVFKELLKNKNKKVITQSLYDECKAKSLFLSSLNESDRVLILNNETEDIVYEAELEYLDPTINFPIKCVIDVLKIDTVKKKVYITDNKTTSKEMSKWIKFEVENSMAWLQAAINYKAVKEFISNNEMFKDYDVEFGFALVDKSNNAQLVKVTQPTMDSYLARTVDLLLNKVNYHLTQKDFRAPAEYLEFGVCL